MPTVTAWCRPIRRVTFQLVVEVLQATEALQEFRDGRLSSSYPKYPEVWEYSVFLRGSPSCALVWLVFLGRGDGGKEQSWVVAEENF